VEGETACCTTLKTVDAVRPMASEPGLSWVWYRFSSRANAIESACVPTARVHLEPCVFRYIARRAGRWSLTKLWDFPNYDSHNGRSHGATEAVNAIVLQLGKSGAWRVSPGTSRLQCKAASLWLTAL
jgi:hypothetical protein